MTFRTHEDIFWIVEMLDYNPESTCLRVLVKDYNASDITNYDRQVPSKTVDELLFEKFDWRKLELLLTHYQKSRLSEFLINIDTNPFSRGEKQIPVLVNPSSGHAGIQSLSGGQQVEQLPGVSIITDDFWIYYTDAHFMLGYVAFKKHIRKIGTELDFKIPNELILAEFDNFKFWFAKKLKTNKFKVFASITLSGNEVITTSATSKHLEQITPELIDGVKYQQTFALTKESRVSSPDKSLFTAEEIFTQMDTVDIEGNVFKQSKEYIFNFFLEESDVRNKKQHAYLAGKK